RDRNSTELFLVEGDSAGGPAKQGRDSAIQAILPLRGKIINVEKARLDKILNFSEIQKIISALGCGIGNDEFDLTKLRYGKVIIMTDADVDGSHIRTLLLTFFYRHMKPLILEGHVFIAQPPLYLVKRKKHKEYVLDERQMRQSLISLGLEGTSLRVFDLSTRPKRIGASGRKAASKRDTSQTKLIMEFNGAKLRDLIDVLEQLAEKVHIIERRGLDFAKLMANRKKVSSGEKLPTHWALLDGRDIFCHSAKEYEDTIEKISASSTDSASIEKSQPEPSSDDKPGQTDDKKQAEPPEVAETPRIQKQAELHEVRDIEKILARLKKMKLSIEDYFLTRQESVTGQKDPAKYVLENADGLKLDLDNVAGIVPGVRQIGSKDIEIKRFKGLGEMNADELWETTMDPARRVLLRVKAEEAEEAERLFSLLMGDNVERRRNFIEEHALEVKNLDV
ncbi:MAG: toprim domain-containing protein, partial [Planctomycetota bacterium]|nr:toprim domain-containing protein [Planctomycetota bacterium]